MLKVATLLLCPQTYEANIVEITYFRCNEIFFRKKFSEIEISTCANFKKNFRKKNVRNFHEYKFFPTWQTL